MFGCDVRETEEEYYCDGEGKEEEEEEEEKEKAEEEELF
jgi:hypothetical protein